MCRLYTDQNAILRLQHLKHVADSNIASTIISCQGIGAGFAFNDYKAQLCGTALDLRVKANVCVVNAIVL